MGGRLLDQDDNFSSSYNFSASSYNLPLPHRHILKEDCNTLKVDTDLVLSRVCTCSLDVDILIKSSKFSVILWCCNTFTRIPFVSKFKWWCMMWYGSMKTGVILWRCTHYFSSIRAVLEGSGGMAILEYVRCNTLVIL